VSCLQFSAELLLRSPDQPKLGFVKPRSQVPIELHVVFSGPVESAFVKNNAEDDAVTHPCGREGADALHAVSEFKLRHYGGESYKSITGKPSGFCPTYDYQNLHHLFFGGTTLVAAPVNFS
jgi:hypothetical protein